MILKNWWPDDFEYLSLYLLDGKREDVLCMVYDVMEWIDVAISEGKKVFIHCQQGVSRSTTMVVLYLMWKWRKPYREVNSYVKDRRNVASPNPGFIVQLLMWDKRLFTPIAKPRLLMMAPQSSYDPNLIVPKLTTVKNPMTLMSDEVYILHCAERLWIWCGSGASELHRTAAWRVAPLMQKFEKAPSEVKAVAEGEEDAQFWLDLYGGDTPSPRPMASPLRTSGMKTPRQKVSLPKLGGSAEKKLPASPVKLKLNLGTVSVQKKDLNLNLGAIKKSLDPPAPQEASSSSSSSSASESDSSTSESESDTTESDGDEPSASESESEDDEPPRRPAKKSQSTPSTKLRLGDLKLSAHIEGPKSPGPLSPLSNPSLRHSLGLSNSPKRAPPPILTLEQAKRSLELSATSEAGGLKRPSPERRSSLSPQSSSKRISPLSSKRDSLEKRGSLERRGSAGSYESTSSSASPHATLTVKMSPRRRDPVPVPACSLSSSSPHLGPVLDNLVIGNEFATDDPAALEALGISDVINVSGAKVNKVANVKTKTFYCDGDVACLFFLVLSRIKEADKVVLLQGSSKTGPDWASAFAVAFVMWKYAQSVKGARAALEPRSALMTPLSEPISQQLHTWEERLSGLFLESALRMYQVTKHCAKAPTLLVPKLVATPGKAVLKPTEVVIVHADGWFFLWCGKKHKFNTLVGAKKICAQLIDFEGLSEKEPELLQQGKETNVFWKVLDFPGAQ